MIDESGAATAPSPNRGPQLMAIPSGRIRPFRKSPAAGISPRESRQPRTVVFEKWMHREVERLDALPPRRRRRSRGPRLRRLAASAIESQLLRRLFGRRRSAASACAPGCDLRPRQQVGYARPTPNKGSPQASRTRTSRTSGRRHITAIIGVGAFIYSIEPSFGKRVASRHADLKFDPGGRNRNRRPVAASARTSMRSPDR